MTISRLSCPKTSAPSAVCVEYVTAIPARSTSRSSKARFSRGAPQTAASSIGSDRRSVARSRSSRRVDRSCACPNRPGKCCRRQCSLEATHATGGRTRPRGIRVSPGRGSRLERSSAVDARCAVRTPVAQTQNHCRQRRLCWHNWFERATRRRRRRASICLSPKG